MAIENANGNYLKIIRVEDSDLLRKSQMITWELWLNKDKKIAPTNFDRPQVGNTILPDLDIKLNTVADGSKSIKDNRITAAYTALLEQSNYSGWTSC
jgi:hypothetical protein